MQTQSASPTANMLSYTQRTQNSGHVLMPTGKQARRAEVFPNLEFQVPGLHDLSSCMTKGRVQGT